MEINTEPSKTLETTNSIFKPPSSFSLGTSSPTSDKKFQQRQKTSVEKALQEKHELYMKKLFDLQSITNSIKDHQKKITDNFYTQPLPQDIQQQLQGECIELLAKLQEVSSNAQINFSALNLPALSFSPSTTELPNVIIDNFPKINTIVQSLDQIIIDVTKRT